MSQNPSLTVILPAHNAEETIAQAIASTLNQTYTDFELWVLENGSTDRTAEIARSFTDPRVKVFELGPVGFQGALQYGIENSSSDWLARMDADDLMFPDRLRVQMKTAREHPEFVLIGTAFGLLTPFGHIFERILNCSSREVDSLRLGRDRFFANPSTVFKRKVALEVGCIESPFTTDDIPLWFRLLTRGKGWEIAEPLHLYRLQPNSVSKSIECYRQGILARKKYAPETLKYWPPRREGASSGWFEIAGLELLANNGATVRQAAKFVELESPRAAQRLRWASRLRNVGYACYRWRYPSKYQYRYRPDWEQLFAPLLALQTTPSEPPSC
jgi:glycosyltransferase involved in cell wall biosynthesis